MDKPDLFTIVVQIAGMVVEPHDIETKAGSLHRLDKIVQRFVAEFLEIGAKIIQQVLLNALRHFNPVDLHAGIPQGGGDKIAAGDLALARHFSGPIEIPGGAVPAGQERINEIRNEFAFSGRQPFLLMLVK